MQGYVLVVYPDKRMFSLGVGNKVDEHIQIDLHWTPTFDYVMSGFEKRETEGTRCDFVEVTCTFTKAPFDREAEDEPVIVGNLLGITQIDLPFDKIGTRLKFKKNSPLKLSHIEWLSQHQYEDSIEQKMHDSTFIVARKSRVRVSGPAGISKVIVYSLDSEHPDTRKVIRANISSVRRNDNTGKTSVFMEHSQVNRHSLEGLTLEDLDENFYIVSD